MTMSLWVALACVHLPLQSLEADGREPIPDVRLPVVTTMGEFWSIPADQRDSPHWAQLEIAAMYYDRSWKLLWGSDRSGPAYVPLESTSPALKSGQRFRVSGPFIPSRGLPLETATITILDPPSPPVPLDANGDLANTERLNTRVVTVDAYVNSQEEVGADHLQLSLAIDGLLVQANVLLEENSPIPQLAGAIVRLIGVYVATDPASPDPPNFWISRAENVTVIDWLDRHPAFTRPAIAIDGLSAVSSADLVRVLGTVQKQTPGKSIVVQDGTGQLTLLSGMTRPVPPGTTIEAIGYPTVDGLDTLLQRSLYRIPTDGSSAATSTTTRGLAVLRLAEQVRRLKMTDAQRAHPVRLQGVVIWTRPSEPYFYMLDASGAVRVARPPGQIETLAAGTSVQVIGHTIGDHFAPAVAADSVILLGTRTRPDPRRITLEQAMTGIEESQWISLSGFVRTVRRDRDVWRLALTTSAGAFTAVIPPSERSLSLEGAVVELRGICRATTDDHRQLTGIELWVSDDHDIRIEESRPADPFVLPTRSIGSLRQFNTLDALNRRVHVTGVVLHHEPGIYLHLQDDEHSLTAFSLETTPLAPGDRIEVVGFPGRQAQRLVLREAVFRRISTDAGPAAIPVQALESAPAQFDGRLVRIEADIASVMQRPDGARLVGSTRGTLFEALLPARFAEPPGTWLPGSHVALTGVYVTQFDHNAQPNGFQLQLRTPDDVVLLASPPWWNAARTRTAAASLALGTILGLAWVFALRRRVRHQTAQIRAQLEKSSRLEAELVRSSKLESLGVLAGGIAHDFNNLLTVIMGNLSLVINDRRFTGEDDRFLRESERAALRARDLTQQLLTFAKGGAPVLNAVLLPDIVREAAGFALHGSNVRCDFDFAFSLWPAHVDRGQVSQVVHNIVINAMHAMPTGGVIRISLRNDEIPRGATGAPGPGRFLRLVISDRGTGITPEHLARIFDPYFTTKQQGSGLGLATVYSIVKKHGGHIDVKSSIGAGTTFHIWLPAASRVPGTSPHPSPRLPRLSGHALFMDDEAPVRQMATAMLRRLGLDVTVASNGTEAIRAYRAAHDSGHPFSVVILDLTVPGAMGGREALDELLKIDPDVRCVVSSGYSDDPIIAHYREHGFRGCVPKPYEFEKLAGTLAEVMGEPRAVAIG